MPTTEPAGLKAAFLAELHSHQQLEQLFEHLPDVYFFAKNRQGQFVLANQIFVQQCGFTRESDIIGKTDFDFFPRERAASYVRDDRKVMKEGTSIVNRVELAPEPDSTVNWFVTTKVPLYSLNGDIVGLAGTARDLKRSSTTLIPYNEMEAVILHIRHHFNEPLAVKDLAEIVHLSVSQFERKFKQTFQISPIKHITKVRIAAACKSLSTTSDKISTIAVDTGFYDHSHFTREFKRHMGMSPSTYRQRH